MKFFGNGLIAIGVFIGVCLVIFVEFYVEFFGASIEPSETFTATILGAAIALVGTFVTIYAQAESQEKARIEKDQALVSGIFVKFQDMTNNLYHFRKHIRDSFEENGTGDQGNPGLFIRALAGYPEPIFFTVEERAVFLRYRNAEVFNDVSQWAPIHNSLLNAFKLYGELRQEFTLKTPATISGGDLGTSTFTSEEFKSVAPIIAQLNHLAAQLQERCERDYTECSEAMMKIRAEVQEICKIQLNLECPE